jgi:uncharacterized protein
MKINEPLRVILDTNVLMVSVLPHHKYYWIFKTLIQEHYNLLISNEILEEYQEKLAQFYGISKMDIAMKELLSLPNVELISPTYRWTLIRDDPDDDKFVDCAVAGNADFIVSHDKHFNVLQTVPFPIIKVIKIPAFQSILKMDL